MPTYNFVCEKCGYTDDYYLQIVNRNANRCCPKCRSLMSKLIGSGGAIIFKGDGFYCNREKKK